MIADGVSLPRRRGTPYPMVGAFDKIDLIGADGLHGSPYFYM